MTDQVAPPRNEAMLEHAWKYFALHAGQRMSVFNFFLVLSGVVCAGLAATLRGPRHLSWMGAILGMLLVLVAFVFLKLDQRTAFLVKHAETALAQLEQDFSLDAARLAGNEPLRTQEASRSGALLGMWTYGTAFRLVFATMALAGIVGAALSIARHFFHMSWLG